MAGTDVSVITYGRQVHEAMSVASELSSEGIDVEVVDLRCLVPLDRDAMLTSVRGTRRAVVYHEAVVRGGFGAEIAAQISAACFGDLLSPVERVGAVDRPLPYASALERLALPGPGRLAEALRISVGAAPRPAG